KRFLFGDARRIGGHGTETASPSVTGATIAGATRREPSGLHELVPLAKAGPMLQRRIRQSRAG
ncbi:MAG TPA: hypothetical protein PLR41_19605, partial [Alphaproteobacteria bacterium]|nr:hypothetical protein [Alphaproteobacteria bacterium]